LIDLAGCDSHQQIIMPVWHTFFKFEAHQTAIFDYSGLSLLTQQVQIQEKCTEQPSLSAEGCHTRLDGQQCPLRTYQGLIFWMNKKGFNLAPNIFLYPCRGLEELHD
jgi:hypothetical protein